MIPYWDRLQDDRDTTSRYHLSLPIVPECFTQRLSTLQRGLIPAAVTPQDLCAVGAYL